MIQNAVGNVTLKSPSLPPLALESSDSAECFLDPLTAGLRLITPGGKLKPFFNRSSEPFADIDKIIIFSKV